VSTAPSLPANSTMTRHFIPLPRPAVFGLAHTTPRFETVSVLIFAFEEGQRAAGGTLQHGALRTRARQDANPKQHTQ
jgi:hypothetical protein